MAEKADRTDLREACIQAVQTCSRTMSDFHQEVEGDIEALKVELVKKASGQDTFNELTAVVREYGTMHMLPKMFSDKNWQICRVGQKKRTKCEKKFCSRLVLKMHVPFSIQSAISWMSIKASTKFGIY